MQARRSRQILKIDNLPHDFNAGTKNKLKRFGDIISSLSDTYKNDDAYRTAEKIIKDSGILEEYSSNNNIENISKRENINELLNAIRQYCEQKRAFGDDNPSLADFLSEVSLLTDQDTDNEEGQSKVTLMTIHAAKGLEFRYVFVVGVEENLFPSPMCYTEPEIEEERRLLYVAITRAKERCFLSYSKTRFRWGSVVYCTPSRFLNDIDERYLDVPTSFNQYDSNIDTFDSENSYRFPSFSKQKTTTNTYTTEAKVLIPI